MSIVESPVSFCFLVSSLFILRHNALHSNEPKRRHIAESRVSFRILFRTFLINSFIRSVVLQFTSAKIPMIQSFPVSNFPNLALSGSLSFSPRFSVALLRPP
ncbi:hypothetical protein VNO78_21421 [Psophocarpus tetragonolobus]|uniref:Uncharacterized protein n=1 Tax=Psophocarpus tetragonolobus TaxID=3891 RepID=A0AAN9SCB2_PSOTE